MYSRWLMSPGDLLGLVAAALLAGLRGARAGLVIALLFSAAVVFPRAAWTRTAVRVAGSWVAAMGMLMFGWLVRGTG
jgi:hypothetical protein